MWIVLPERPFLQNFTTFNESFKPKNPNFNSDFQKTGPSFSGFSESAQVPLTVKKDKGSGRSTAGLFLIAIGSYFMLEEFHVIPDWFSIIKLWPLLIIAAGLIILFKSGKKKPLQNPVMNWGENSENQSSNTLPNQPLS